MLSQDGRWRDVIPVLERSLYYTRGREEFIVEAMGWLGTAHLKVGNIQEATDLLLSIPRTYPEQIAMSLRAYGNLIKHSVTTGDTSATERYLASAEAYAEQLINSGESASYPMLGRRMGQIMTLGGDKAAAAVWQQRR